MERMRDYVWYIETDTVGNEVLARILPDDGCEHEMPDNHHERHNLRRCSKALATRVYLDRANLPGQYRIFLSEGQGLPRKVPDFVLRHLLREPLE